MNIENLFKELVSIDSPSKHEDEMRKFISEFCSDRGVKLSEDSYGNLYFANKNSELMLTAHMDTVQGGDHIEPVIDGSGVIRSKGETILGADDKAGLAGILMVVDYFHEQKIDPNFELLFTVEEEIGMEGAKNFDTSVLFSKVGLSFDKSGSNFGDIVLVAPYGIVVEIIIKGKSTHSSLPENGINALKVAGEVISQLPLGGKNNETTFNLGTIEGGTTGNTVPERVRMFGDIRSHNPDKVDDLQNKITNILESVTTKYKAEFSVDFDQIIEGYSISSEDEFIKKVVSGLDSMGVKSEMLKSSGGSDASVLNGKGIKTILVSSGAQMCHTNEEFISIEDLESIFELQKLLLCKNNEHPE